MVTETCSFRKQCNKTATITEFIDGKNPGRFGPIPVRSGRFGPGRFGPISGVSRFGPVGRVVSALFHRWVVSARFLG